MSWVERYAEARKSQSRSRAIVARTRPLTIGVILAACGGYGLYSDTTHQINGRPATATLSFPHIKSNPSIMFWKFSNSDFRIF